MLLSISEKLDSTQRIRVADSGQIDYLITELEPTNPSLISYVNKGINVL
jgi:hypothetical protein